VTKVNDEPSYPCALFINHHEYIPVDDEKRMENIMNYVGE
jgi:hypothetical protein